MVKTFKPKLIRSKLKYGVIMGIFDKLIKRTLKQSSKMPQKSNKKSPSKAQQELKSSFNKFKKSLHNLGVGSEEAQDDIRTAIETLSNELTKMGYSEDEINHIIKEELIGEKINKDIPSYKWILGECKLSEEQQQFFKDERLELIDGKYCPDCLNNEGLINTLEGWEAVGVPPSGSTLCREGCGCKLEKVKT